LNARPISYQDRIAALTKTKLEHTHAKTARDGYHDIDDHGIIYWPDPIPFELKPNHANGRCYGARCIGENFRAWLDAHPVFIHPQSALAGAWAGTVPVGGWRPEDRPHHLAELHETYHLQHNGIGAMNHLGPDMTIGLTLGWGGLLAKIRHYRAFNRPVDTSFYDAEENLVLGVQDWIRRHAGKAREMAEETGDPAVRENMLAIAEMNAWLVENPPRTLREACQFLAWFQSIDRMWHAGGALGQLDELLRPYYEAETAGLSPEELANYEELVVWCVASLLYNDTHYSQVGGEAPDGRDLTSPISFLILEAAHRLKIPYNLAVRVHDTMDPELLRRALEYHLQDGTGASFSCSKGLNEGFVRAAGVPLQLARMRAKVGCNWTALPGIEYPLQDITRQCLIKPFILAFEETVADAPEARTIEALWERYAHHLAISVDTMKQGFDWHMKYHARNMIEIVLDLFCHGTIERGLDAAEGGVDLYNLTVDGVGLATVADSFAAVEQRVVQEGRITWEELKDVLDRNFEGDEAIRLMLKNIDRFGSGGSRADFWAQRIARSYVEMYDTRTPDHFRVLPGLFSHGDIVRLGSHLPATPNGRRAGEPISHSSEPDPGFARHGGSPTAKAVAVAAVQPGRGNSAPLQLDIDYRLMEEQGGIDTVAAMIMTHNEQGGTLVNLNILSRDKILAAHADPSLYPDLVVRVTGYSAYFHTLSPEYRQQVVDRILAE
jgi:pyruvate-formate lyase